MANEQPIAGVILAGGRATRMGGGDKCLVLLDHRPILAHVIERLAPQVAALALNANGEPGRFAPPVLPDPLPVLPDPLPGQPGPLAGLLAGLNWAAGSGFAWLVSVTADTPFLPRDLVQRLRASGPPGPAIATSPDATGQPRRHPTIGLWPTALRDDLRAALIGGERRVGVWAGRHGATEVCFAQTPDPFFNINTPQDLSRARARVRQTAR